MLLEVRIGVSGRDGCTDIVSLSPKAATLTQFPNTKLPIHVMPCHLFLTLLAQAGRYGTVLAVDQRAGRQ